jgi:hypothetical protein
VGASCCFLLRCEARVAPEAVDGFLLHLGFDSLSVDA